MLIVKQLLLNVHRRFALVCDRRNLEKRRFGGTDLIIQWECYDKNVWYKGNTYLNSSSNRNMPYTIGLHLLLYIYLNTCYYYILYPHTHRTYTRITCKYVDTKVLVFQRISSLEQFDVTQENIITKYLLISIFLFIYRIRLCNNIFFLLYCIPKDGYIRKIHHPPRMYKYHTFNVFPKNERSFSWWFRGYNCLIVKYSMPDILNIRQCLPEKNDELL